MSEDCPEQPLVSIVIPVYNGGNFLREAIDSALAQTYSNCEIIVVNDGSNDDGETERIALSYGNRIRYIAKSNGGVASALNVGINEMAGDYFSWLSHDDVFYPDKTSKQIDFISGINGPVVLYCDYDVIDQYRTVIRTMVHHYRPEELCRALVTDNPVHGCTVLIPKKCFATVGLFNETLRTTQDYDMWFRMAQHFDFIHLPQVLLQAREHGEQGTITMSPLHVKECNELLIDGMLKILRTLDRSSPPDSRKQFLAECLTSFSDRGFHKASRYALCYYCRSILLDGSLPSGEAIRPIRTFIVRNIYRVCNITSYILSK
jgi:hypothetical protein